MIGGAQVKKADAAGMKKLFGKTVSFEDVSTDSAFKQRQQKMDVSLSCVCATSEEPSGYSNLAVQLNALVRGHTCWRNNGVMTSQ